jgi:hypothetical protein
VIKVGKKFCHLVFGKEKVEVLINKNKTRVISIGEYNSNEYGGGIFIFIVSLFIIYLSIKSIFCQILILLTLCIS